MFRKGSNDVSDNDLPDIPSFEELGISPDELEELEKELEDGGDGAETSPSPDVAAAAPPPPEAETPPQREKSKGRGKSGDAQPPGEGGSADGKAAAVGPPPMGGARGPVTVVLLLLVAWFSSSFRTIPSPVAANAPDTAFSSARAMAHVTEIARVAHPPGSPEHVRVREYLLSELRELGVEPEVQTTTSVIGRGAFVRAATVRNILARIPGSASGEGAVLVTAHYDSREIAKGAGDDGSGVVTILETVRALQARSPLRNDLIVLLTDAEELGLLGARGFVDEHPWMEDVTLVVSIEMRGGGGPSLMFETGAENGWVVAALREADPYPSANSVAYEIYRRMPNDTDFTPFKEAGVQGLNFAAVGNAHVYHQTYDSPENLSEATLQHHGSHALAMLEYFGNADLTSVDAPDVSYVSVPVVGLVTYGKTWIWLLGALTLLGWGIAALVGRKRGARTGGLIFGLGAGLVYMGLVGAVAYFLYEWREPSHLEVGALHAGTFHNEGAYVVAIVALAFAVGALWFGLLRRWFSAAELTIGGLLPPVLLALVATVMFPFGAMNVQWPALAGCVGALAVTGVARSHRLGFLRWLLVLVAAVPVIVVLTPLTEAVWITMSLALAPVIGVMIGMAFLLLVPALDVVREPNAWWAPLVGVLVAAGSLGLGMRAATPSPDRPAPSTLVYLLDREAGVAFWGTDATRDDSDPGVAWAMEQIGSFDQVQELSGFVAGEVRYRTAPAAVAEAALPGVAVVNDTTLPRDRVRLSVRSGIGAEMMLFELPDDGPNLVSVNGKTLTGDERVAYAEHWGAPEGSGVVLEFERDFGDEAITFVVVEHLLRPGELVGTERFSRPPDLAPNIRRLSDRAMVRTPVSVGLDGGAVTVGGQPPAGVVDESGEEADTTATVPDSTAAPVSPSTSPPPPDTVPR